MTGTKLKYQLHVQKLHARCGDFVRTGPRELTIFRASAIKLIYGSSSRCTKGAWYDQNSGDPDKVGIENLRDAAKHRLRRKAWDKGLGLRGNAMPAVVLISRVTTQLSNNVDIALDMYEARVAAKVNQLMAGISTGKPVNITQHSTFYAWDVMGEIAFSKDFGLLE